MKNQVMNGQQLRRSSVGHTFYSVWIPAAAPMGEDASKAAGAGRAPVCPSYRASPVKGVLKGGNAESGARPLGLTNRILSLKRAFGYFPHERKVTPLIG